MADQLAHLGDEEDSWSHTTLRSYLCFSLLETESLHNRLPDNSIDGLRNYADRMSKVDVPGDNVMLLTAATIFKRRIRVYPVFKAKYPVINFNPVGGIKPKPGDINLLEYSKDHFTQQFYMSIIQDPNKRKSLPTSESPMESTGHNFSSNESRLSIASGEFSGLFDDSRNTENGTTPTPPKSKHRALRAEKQDERSV